MAGILLINVNKIVYICTVNTFIDTYKGIHPGIILKREFKKRSLRQRPFALSIGEHPQTLNAITKGRRNLNTLLALKIEDKLGMEEGTLALLQTFYDIQKEKRHLTARTPDLTILRTSLFWDTNRDRIDWEEQYKAVIKRVFERGNDQEKDEISRFYGLNKVKSVLNAVSRKPYTILGR